MATEATFKAKRGNGTTESSDHPKQKNRASLPEMTQVKTLLSEGKELMKPQEKGMPAQWLLLLSCLCGVYPLLLRHMRLLYLILVGFTLLTGKRKTFLFMSITMRSCVPLLLIILFLKDENLSIDGQGLYDKILTVQH